jgi:hypothetical protein
MKTYEFSFKEALGDTIMEKFESLYVLLVQCNAENKINFVVGYPDFTSIFETVLYGFESFGTFQAGDVGLAGKFDVSKLKFHIFKSEQVAKDELVLFGQTGNAVIKFTDYY